MMDDRLDKIETALAHHEQQIQDLNDVVNRQWEEIDRLRLLLHKAEAKLSAIEAGDDRMAGLSTAEIAAMEKPPHY